MSDKVYTEVEANGFAFECPLCKSKLEEVHSKAVLTEDEQRSCRVQIERLQDELQQFDTYVVPAKFFGPGHQSAYVGFTAEYALEDPSNVDWIISSDSYLGSLRKQPEAKVSDLL